MTPPSDSGRLSRRSFLRHAVAAGAALTATGVPGRVFGGVPGAAEATGSATPEDLRYPFELPPLPYPAAALEPGIDTATMEIHHGRHHRGYVDKLNAALADRPTLQAKTLGELLAEPEKIPAEVRDAVRNNGGGHANHTLFWATLTPGGRPPEGAFLRRIETDFGSFGNLREAMVTSGLQQFGSGWAWLCLEPSDGVLVVEPTPNQDNPLRLGLVPLIGVDVWEHAYYLNYQNRRGDYLRAWLELADWREAGRRHQALTS